MGKKKATPVPSPAVQMDLFAMPTTEPSNNTSGIEPTQVKPAKKSRSKREHTPALVDNVKWKLCPRFTIYKDGIVIFNIDRWLLETASDWFVTDDVSLGLLVERGISAEEGKTVEKRLLIALGERANGQPFIEQVRSPDVTEELTFISSKWFADKYIKAEYRDRYLRDALWPFKAIEEAVVRPSGGIWMIEQVRRYFCSGQADERVAFIEAEHAVKALTPRDRHVIDANYKATEYKDAVHV